jgi:hypothetical protein
MRFVMPILACGEARGGEHYPPLSDFGPRTSDFRPARFGLSPQPEFRGPPFSRRFPSALHALDAPHARHGPRGRL